jgi:hypothetical protein
MPEAFRYEPTILTMQGDVVDAFANLYPDHAGWLRDHAVEHRVTVYCWPDFLARMMCNRIGTIVCEFEVTVDSAFAERFAAIKNGSCTG